LLFPVQNKFRSSIDLSGLWKFRIDPEQNGESSGWFRGFSSDCDIAVPGSWNEQLEEAGLLHYVGLAWYRKNFFIPSEWANKSVFIRFDSADYFSKVWVNGILLGENNLGFLPFEFDITDCVKCGEESEVVICLNNQLSDEGIPQGITAKNYLEENRLREETFPAARFDFSPFGGIHRPVYLLAKPETHLNNIKINTSISSTNGLVEVSADLNAELDGKVMLKIVSTDSARPQTLRVSGNSFRAQIKIDNCQFWSPEFPHLYTLKIVLQKDDKEIDEYSLPIGIREVKITNNKLYLNGKEIYLKGFGKHEDFPVIGKGLLLPLMVKDFQMMKWINANSFRTSHYPYAEEMMYYADQKGILIIDEIPAVSLDFRYVSNKTLDIHKEYIKRLFERDYNHPSVIIWSLGNEPNLVGDGGYYNGKARKYWEEVFAYSRSIDPSRPKTVPNCLRAGIQDPVLALSDIVSINRYYGWYEYPGRLDCGLKVLEEELDAIFAKYNKPVLMTEFGVDALPGYHSTSDQMFTEEYQGKFLEQYIKLLRSKKFVIGEHVWNFADFRTPQNMRRVLLNMKGVFTRNRDPKASAFLLKNIWNGADVPTEQ
jgi:beta-glucuronidase